MFLSAALVVSSDELVDRESERLIAKALSDALKSIPPGNNTAGEYHALIMGIVELMFFPSLLCPKKEAEIHEGRKRIDIVMENGATDGIFSRLHEIRKVHCPFVAIECKNYTREVANPELDQLAGRFSQTRGRLGFMFCRAFENRDLFLDRCRDTHKDGRGLIVPFDDDTCHRILGMIASGVRRDLIDGEIGRLVDEVAFS